MGQELRWTYRRSHCHAPLQARSAEITPWCSHRLARLVGHRDQARALHAVPHVRSFCRLPGSERGVRSQQRKSPATTQVLDHRPLSQLSSAHGTQRTPPHLGGMSALEGRADSLRLSRTRRDSPSTDLAGPKPAASPGTSSSSALEKRPRGSLPESGGPTHERAPRRGMAPAMFEIGGLVFAQ